METLAKAFGIALFEVKFERKQKQKIKRKVRVEYLVFVCLVCIFNSMRLKFVRDIAAHIQIIISLHIVCVLP